MTAPTTPVPLTGAVADARPAPKALTTRLLDFWLLGGASILVWLVMISLEGFRGSWAIGQHFSHLTATTLSLSLLINYPHFLMSYKLAYTRGRSFVFGHWWQLIVVPIALAGIFAAAYLFYDVPVDSLPIVSRASQTVGAWGANAQELAGPRTSGRGGGSATPRSTSSLCRTR